ncbi:DUF2911 domain-containing protein [Flavobacteriaceae bacterium 3-367]
MMKFAITAMVFTVLQWSYGQSDPFLSLPRQSPAASVTQRIGLTDITINYSSPRINDRKVWGAMVPFNNGKPFPWRAGANENTTITFTDNVSVEGNKLAAGTYGIHMIPTEGNWTVMFSKTNSAWGSFGYKEAEDALRITVSPEETKTFYEWLTYEFADKGQDFAVASLLWANKRIPFKVEVDVHTAVMKKVEAQLKDLRQVQWQPWYYAANYCLTNNVDLEQGLDWINTSIGKKENFTNLKTKAGFLAKMGKNEESAQLMKTAINHPSADSQTLYVYGRSLLSENQIGKAMEVYRLSAKRYPNVWLAEHGLARAYSAEGNYKKALALEKKALAKAPEIRHEVIKKYIGHLEKGQDFNKY